MNVDCDLFTIDTGIINYADYPSLTPELNIVEARSFGIRNPYDKNGHGTAVAGCAAAIDNDAAIVGVAPGVRVHSYRAFNDRNTARDSDIISAINAVVNWKTANPSKPAVLNMSFGSNVGTATSALEPAVTRAINARITCVAAAGNSSLPTAFFVPARVSGVIAVGAYYDVTDVFASFSNYGPRVDILAPGVNILTLAVPTRKVPGETIFVSGTSFSAPYVAGAACLILAKNPTYTPAQVTAAIKDAAAASTAAENPRITGVRTIDTTTLSLWVANF